MCIRDRPRAQPRMRTHQKHVRNMLSTSGEQHGRPKTGSRATTASTGQRVICSSRQLVWIHMAGGQITQKHLTTQPHTTTAPMNMAIMMRALSTTRKQIRLITCTYTPTTSIMMNAMQYLRCVFSAWRSARKPFSPATILAAI